MIARVRRRQPLDRLLGRSLVRLGEHDIEGDDRRALRRQLVEEIGHDRPRPRPLADPRQRLLVDVDDAHRQVRVVGCRRQALVGIEGDQPQRLHEERIGETQHRRAAEYAQERE